MLRARYGGGILRKQKNRKCKRYVRKQIKKMLKQVNELLKEVDSNRIHYL